MPTPIILLPFCVLGALIGHLTLKKDRFSTGLGIAIGLVPAFAITHHNLVYILAILIFAPLLIWRKRYVHHQSSVV